MLTSDEASNLSAVQRETAKLIRQATGAERPQLIEAPPVGGKTTESIALTSEIESPVTYLAARRDLYDQAKRIAKDHGDIEWEIIPAPHRDCPTFDEEKPGDHLQARRLYQKGLSGREIHFHSDFHTPCGESCPYLDTLTRLDEGIHDIDLLIGHHSHIQRRRYIEDRIVFLDEFHPDPFVKRFPDETTTIRDPPGETIESFLNALAEEETDFPSRIRDLTDLVEARFDPELRSEAICWFQEWGVDRSSAEQEFDFYRPSTAQYDYRNLWAPFITFGMLCMERLGPGLEVAPHPNGDRKEDWLESDLAPGAKCLRNRDSGQIFVLDPPDVSHAKQVIGLDAIPNVTLWNQLYVPETGFEHRRVISREHMTDYLESALNMSTIQIGGGMHHYAAGEISPLDKDRLEYIRAVEGRRFPLISSRNALLAYADKGLIEDYVTTWDEPIDGSSLDSRLFEDHKALHFALVRSSNVFEKEDLGVVMGTPYPGDDLVRIWAGFCGEYVNSSNTGEAKTFGEFGDAIFRHFCHDQVVQAVLRFGRHESIWQGDGSTIYLSSLAVPDWFEASKTVKVQSKNTLEVIAKELIKSARSDSGPPGGWERVGTVHEKVTSANEEFADMTKDTTRSGLRELVDLDLVNVREKSGSYCADLYQWDGEDSLHRVRENEYIIDGGRLAFTVTIDATERFSPLG